ncbi:hypothetical protein BH23DEI1_BH23DEI1_15380 [soil metagenome]|nr:hypothetical protein [Trueperaceae bacterium]
MPTDRLLGSFLLRVAVREGARSISLHSVLTGDSQRFTSFAELATHLDRATGSTHEGVGSIDPDRTGTAEP